MQTQTETTELSIKNKTAKRKKEKLMDHSGPLKCNPIAGQHLRWVSVNDTAEPRNEHWAEGQNYVNVHPREQGYSADSQYTKDMGSDIRVTGKDGITLKLMKQPQEDYEESINEMLDFNNRQVMRAVDENSNSPHGIRLIGKRLNMNATNIKGI